MAPRFARLRPLARDLVHRARRSLPSIGEVEPEAARIAIRPIPGDHLSAIGPMPQIRGYYLAITRSGVTMSPFLGAAVANEVVRGRQRAELADFRPARHSHIPGSRSGAPSAAVIDRATSKSMSATHAGSTSGGNLCHLLVRHHCNVVMSKSDAPVVAVHWSSRAVRAIPGSAVPAVGRL
jgi:hypothetical protein